MTEYVDRGAILEGQNKTARDIRIPFNVPRSIENFTLSNDRPKRRLGFGVLHNAVRTQALAKHTGTQYTKRLLESDHNKGTIALTPLSYGLIRWNTDFQLRRAEPKTVEFCLRLGDREEAVTGDFNREANYAGNWIAYEFRKGVYILDQTIISNKHKFDTGSIQHTAVVPGTTYDMGTVLNADQFDSLPLTSMAFRFTGSLLMFEFGMVESTGANIGRYWKGIMSYPWPTGAYTVGDIYHVALTYDPALGAGPGRFILYINGVAEVTLDIPVTVETFKFVGEYDVINGITYATGQKRDIVLLNECTVRGSYSSACKIRGTMHGHQTFHHNFSTLPNKGVNPWCLSPPRGTAMWDLRIWNEARSSTNVAAFKLKRINQVDAPTNLKGNWHLNDGGPVCLNKKTGLEKRYCTLHHSYPGYVKDPLLLSGQGLKLGDGQYLLKSIGKNDKDFGSGLAAQLSNIFFDSLSATAFLAHRDQNSFSVMIQIMVPDTFQPELNDDAAAGLTMKDLPLVETRRAMNTGAGPYDSLLDGQFENAATARNFVGHATDPAVGPDIQQHLRAYDQTLWSIEGTQRKDDATVATNEADRRRIPVARGVLTPAGKVGFELFKSQLAGAQPKYFRLLSATTLVVGSVYTLTFIQRVNYVYNGGTHKLDADGWKMEIWLQNVTAGTAAALDSSYTVAAASPLTTTPLIHEQNYDISVGASYVNDGWDHSINMPFPNGAVATPKTSYAVAPSTKRENHGPWPVQQRFMSPYQDQPGNFVVGMFRIWSLSLPEASIKNYGNSLIATKDQTVDLLVNLEFREVVATEIPNKSRYPDTFILGFKSWGMPQGYRNQIYQTINLSAYLKKEMFEGAWAYEDCLGYVPISFSIYDSVQSYCKVNGLASFRASFGQQFGLLEILDDAALFDDTISGSGVPLFAANHGLISEFFPGLDWQGTEVGDRTILTSSNSLPKVFNGKLLTTAGFKRWSGGSLVTYETAAVPGGLTADRWYGIVVVYFSEEYGIYQVSPVATVKVIAASNAIGIYMVPPHPDSRVTLVEVYRTIGQLSESLAASAPLFKTKINSGGGGAAKVSIAGGNCYAESITISDNDTTLTAVLDRNVTEMPVCAFSASLYERLYLFGDVLNPDVVYFTDPGNPERIDAFVNNIRLPESSGDIGTGLVAAFDAVFVFKPNGIWRIDDNGGNQIQITKLGSIGAVSSKSIQVFTNPDTRRQLIFFWSEHGPYLFDGQNSQYIGYPIEETYPEYSWLNPSSVVVGHYASSRELICFYAPKRNGTQLDRNGEAVVFNYRNNKWYTYTGLVGSIALSLNFSGSLIEKDPITNLLKTNRYLLLLGGKYGKVYSWGTSFLDGIIGNPTQAYPLSLVIAPAQYRILTMPITDEMIGNWLTIISAVTGDWITAPITKVNVVNTEVFVDSSWLVGATFVPAPNDLIYIGQPPAKIEYPWDDLGIPFYDKLATELITWHDGLFRHRYRLNYDPLTKFDWTALADGNSKRKRTQLNKKLESIKLEFSSLVLGSSMDAFAYAVSKTRGANTGQ